MEITITVPDEVFQRLKSKWGNVSKRSLEALVVEFYRKGEVTAAEVQRMLKLSSRWEVEEFLNRAQAYIEYTEEDLQQDIEMLRRATK